METTIDIEKAISAICVKHPEAIVLLSSLYLEICTHLIHSEEFISTINDLELYLADTGVETTQIQGKTWVRGIGLLTDRIDTELSTNNSL